ncbi:MAG: NAD(P)-dependent oxidoreductase [Verrucomicrobiota bacterium]|nr:NAD(P)-dependent oxidoreductase [Verrucomicrobiota bacterium]
MTIGVVGLGIIGSVWARHYHAAGRLAGAWNRTAKPDFPCWKKTPEEIAAAVDVTQIVVADPPAVRSVLEKLLPALGPAKIVVQSSTIDPQSSDEFRRLVTERGARYLEAPFTGSKPAAEQKQTVFYLGGDAALCAEVEPSLALISTTRFHIGDHRQAAALKLAMNLNIAAQMEALAEALMFVRRAGVKDDVFFAALAKNASYSGLTKLKEPKLRTGDFSPQFSVKHMHKDMRLAAATAKFDGQAGVAWPLLETVRERLRLAEERGLGDEDFSALLKLL